MPDPSSEQGEGVQLWTCCSFGCYEMGGEVFQWPGESEPSCPRCGGPTNLHATFYPAPQSEKGLRERHDEALWRRHAQDWKKRAREAEARLKAVREWARGYPQTDNPDWGEFIKAQHQVEEILSSHPVQSEKVERHPLFLVSEGGQISRVPTDAKPLANRLAQAEARLAAVKEQMERIHPSFPREQGNIEKLSLHGSILGEVCDAVTKVLSLLQDPTPDPSSGPAKEQGK